MVKQDKLLIKRSNSDLNKCGFEQMDLQEETPFVRKSFKQFIKCQWDGEIHQ